MKAAEIWILILVLITAIQVDVWRAAVASTITTRSSLVDHFIKADDRAFFIKLEYGIFHEYTGKKIRIA
jgi:hypothetical protein